MSSNAPPAETEKPKQSFRTFVFLWASQSVSVLGGSVAFFSLVVWLTTVKFPDPSQQPMLAASLAIISLSFALPNIFFAPIAGAFTDRQDRRRIMVTADIINGCMCLVTMTLLLTGILEIWMLVGITACIATASAFHSSAFDASYVMIVPREQLPRANGMMHTMWGVAGILSPAIAAFIIALPSLAQRGIIPGGIGEALAGLPTGIPLSFGLNATTFLIAGIVVFILRIPSPKRVDLAAAPGRRKKTLWADIKEGALYIWHRSPLLWLLGTFTVANFATSPFGVIQPLMVKFNLVADWTARGFTYETALALVATMMAAGGVTGGVIVSTWGGLKRKRVFGVVVPLIVVGFGLIVYGLSPYLYLTGALVFLMASMLPMMNAHSQTIWQTQTPPELQGRVFSVRRVIAQCTVPLGTAMAGWAAGVFNPGHFIAFLGAFLAVFCLAQLVNPGLLKVEDKEFLENLAARRVAAAEAAASDKAGGSGGAGGSASTDAGSSAPGAGGR